MGWLCLERPGPCFVAHPPVSKARGGCSQFSAGGLNRGVGVCGLAVLNKHQHPQFLFNVHPNALMHAEAPLSNPMQKRFFVKIQLYIVNPSPTWHRAGRGLDGLEASSHLGWVNFFKKNAKKLAKPPFLGAFLKSLSKFNCYFTLKSAVATIQLECCYFSCGDVAAAVGARWRCC